MAVQVSHRKTGDERRTATTSKRSKAIYSQLGALCASAREEIFEDGMESAFSRKLVAIITRYGDAAIEALADLILSHKIGAEVAAEALRWVGSMEHPETRARRLRLLEQSLDSSWARVRDGAALGIAFLDDPGAIPALKEAIQREQVAELRKDMEQVLCQLESA